MVVSSGFGYNLPKWLLKDLLQSRQLAGTVCLVGSSFHPATPLVTFFVGQLHSNQDSDKSVVLYRLTYPVDIDKLDVPNTECLQ